MPLRSAAPKRRARAGPRPRWCRGRPAPPHRRPGCRRTSCRAARAGTRVARRPNAMQAPIGSPPPSPLARVTTSGSTPAAGARTTRRCGRSRSAPRPAPAAPRPRGLPGRGRGSRSARAGRHPRRAPAPGRPPRSARRPPSAGRRVAVRHMHDTPGSGRNGSCLAGWPVSASAPIVRPWKPPSAATTRGGRSAGRA